MTLASWKGPRAGRLRPSAREIKMLAPRCDVCDEGINTPKGWAETCEHEPFVTLVPIERRQTLYEDVIGKDGKPTGTKRATGQETLVDYVVRPNWVSITLSRGVNSGRGVEKAKRKGFIMPEDVRCEAYPNGIKPRCEFSGCFAEDIKPYKNGNYCRELEAAYVYLAEGEGRTWEVGFNAISSEKQADQVSAALTKVSN